MHQSVHSFFSLSETCKEIDGEGNELSQDLHAWVVRMHERNEEESRGNMTR